MNYICNRDVTIILKKGRMISDESLCAKMRDLVTLGYVDEVPDEYYIKDKTEKHNLFFENGTRLDRLKNIDSFKDAFRKRRIRYNPDWRMVDFQHRATQWMEELISREVKRKIKQHEKHLIESQKDRWKRNGEEY